MPRLLAGTRNRHTLGVHPFRVVGHKMDGHGPGGASGAELPRDPLGPGGDRLEVAAVALLLRGVLQHRPLHEVARLGRDATAEDDLIAGAERLTCLADLGRESSKAARVSRSRTRFSKSPLAAMSLRCGSTATSRREGDFIEKLAAARR